MAEPPVTVVGSYISPYVRKVLVCLDLKGVPYEIDPIVPFFGSDEFSRISPVRRIPVLIDERVTLPDSSAICEYLDEQHPGHPLLPREPAQRARARWLEEFADTRMGEVFIWRLFDQRVIRRTGLILENSSFPKNGTIGSISYGMPFRSRQTSTFRT